MLDFKRRHQKKWAKIQEWREYLTVCIKSYTLNHNLALHIKQTHLGEGFKCHQQCSKSFRTKMELSLHLLSHTSEKPHKCDTCNATFKYQQHLQRHIGSWTSIQFALKLRFYHGQMYELWTLSDVFSLKT